MNQNPRETAEGAIIESLKISKPRKSLQKLEIQRRLHTLWFLNHIIRKNRNQSHWIRWDWSTINQWRSRVCKEKGKRLSDATEFDEIGAPSINGDAEFTKKKSKLWNRRWWKWLSRITITQCHCRWKRKPNGSLEASLLCLCKTPWKFSVQKKTVKPSPNLHGKMPL